MCTDFIAKVDFANLSSLFFLTKLTIFVAIIVIFYCRTEMKHPMQLMKCCAHTSNVAVAVPTHIADSLQPSLYTSLCVIRYTFV